MASFSRLLQHDRTRGTRSRTGLFGTEQVSTMATQLTVAHFMNQAAEELKAMNKIALRNERSKRI